MYKLQRKIMREKGSWTRKLIIETELKANMKSNIFFKYAILES